MIRKLIDIAGEPGYLIFIPVKEGFMASRPIRKTSDSAVRHLFSLRSLVATVTALCAFLGAAEAALKTTPSSVTVARDVNCKLIPGSISVGSGCTATNFRYNVDTRWEPCSGPKKVDEVAVTIRGSRGNVYEGRDYWDGRRRTERPGPLKSVILGPGTYTVLLESGRNTSATLYYDLNCPAPAGTVYEAATLLGKFETNFRQWYEKISGTQNSSIFVKGTDKQRKTKFTWDSVAKDVIYERAYTIAKPGRVYVIAEFRMDDRAEYGLGRLYSVGTVYPKIWNGRAWQDYPGPGSSGWLNYVGYAGNRPILPNPQFKYTGRPGDNKIQVLGTGFPVKPGKYQLAILSAIACDWIAHFPSKGKIFTYFIPD